jgi:hypothetical protein
MTALYLYNYLRQIVGLPPIRRVRYWYGSGMEAMAPGACLSQITLRFRERRERDAWVGTGKARRVARASEWCVRHANRTAAWVGDCAVVGNRGGAA